MGKPPHTLPHDTCERCRINATSNALTVVGIGLFFVGVIVYAIGRGIYIAFQ